MKETSGDMGKFGIIHERHWTTELGFGIQCIASCVSSQVFKWARKCFFVATVLVKRWKIDYKEGHGVGKLYVSMQLCCWAILKGTCDVMSVTLATQQKRPLRPCLQGGRVTLLPG